MADLAAERFGVAAARQAYEAALRTMRTADAHADFWREDDGSFPVVDQPLNQEMFAEIAGLQPALDAAQAQVEEARAVHDEALRVYGERARQDPLFEAGNADPILLLPVRLEAIYAVAGPEEVIDGADEPLPAGTPVLRIRVYPDDIHVDSHEPPLTEGERLAGTNYWRSAWAAGDDALRRLAAWRALVGACSGGRATWVRECLTPVNTLPGEPEFPEVEIREAAWTRAAQTQLLPDHFEFSAYRDGALVWRREGAPITDSLAVGIAPQAAEGEADADTVAFDFQSRWLVDFKLATERGMALVAPLADPAERFDLLTVVGVGQKDGATGAQRVQDMLAAHAFAGGLEPLPVQTPTNNTPHSRSGWRTRSAPPDPDVAAQRRAAFDLDSDQEAARLARALGIDGTTVLAAVCDPAGGDETLLRRLQQLEANYYSWSVAFMDAAETAENQERTPTTAAWYRRVAEHYSRFVRARGPLPSLRIGRQPYGLLPISALGVWRGDDVDEDISLFVGSFLDVFAQGVSRAIQIGEGADQDAILMDLLSREASPNRVIDIGRFTSDLKSERPPPATVGAIPATSAMAWAQLDQEPEDGLGLSFATTEPFPEVVPEALQQVVTAHPLTQLLVLFDEALQRMRDTLIPPDPQEFAAVYFPMREQLAQLLQPPTRSLFYRQAEWVYNALSNTLSSGPDLPERVTARVARGTQWRDLFSGFVAFEDDAAPDLPRFERVFRETLEPLSHRIDAWVTSLATARLALMRSQQPTGIRTGAYGWLTDVEAIDPNPSREGYIVTPSMHHATTAAVLRSGWQAHSDRTAFAVDIQSSRVRRAQALIEGVRSGQTLDALLGYQFERALHDARLDRCIAGFRAAYPLAPLVEPEVPGGDAARVSIGARNVVDGQSLRRDRARLEDPAALQDAAATALDAAEVPLMQRILGELDESFDAVGDLLLAESVHQLVGGNALRAGLAADGAGRGQDLPLDYDVLRTPRGGIGVTHHVGILFADDLPGGWEDDRPLARLQPGLEGWLRHRLGPASGWALGPSLADLGWCALELVVAPAERVRSELTAGGAALDEAVFARLELVCERLRAAVSGATPLTPIHLDAADPAPMTGYDLDELHDRVGPWLGDVHATAADLAAAETPDAAVPILRRLGALGLPVGLAGAGDVDRVRGLVADVDLSAPDAPPDPAAQPAETAAWLAALLAVTAQLLHQAVRVVPLLLRELPPAPAPAPDDDTVAAWLQDMGLVRPKVDALDGAAVAAEVIADTSPVGYVIAQTVVAAAPAGPWIAVAPPVEGPRPRSVLVAQRDAAQGTRVSGLVIDSWTEVVPRAPGKDGPEEVIGVAFDFDRPGARAPQSALIAVAPDLERGWCIEDLHGCLDEALLLARLRTLDLEDLPEVRAVLPIPNAEN